MVDFHSGRSVGTAEERWPSADVSTVVFADTLH
jgi:hypothetical protein